MFCNRYFVQGPDVYFEEQILEHDGVEYSVIVTSELWSERVMLYYVENTPGAWAKPDNIKFVLEQDKYDLKELITIHKIFLRISISLQPNFVDL